MEVYLDCRMGDDIRHLTPSPLPAEKCEGSGDLLVMENLETSQGEGLSGRSFRSLEDPRTKMFLVRRRSRPHGDLAGLRELIIG
ncbi:hypothetical protein ACLKA6_012016 [Drosophila palustris]